MNGIHDLGGMTCFGPVEAEPDEPVFHSDWERRVFAINVAAGAAVGPLDYRRHGIERMPPDIYVRSSYYEKWLARMELLVAETGMLDHPPKQPAQSPDEFESIVYAGRPANRDDARAAPHFAVGDRVRALNLNPTGHTRLPRYVRGRVGQIHRLHGTHVFPDTNAHGQGESPQPLYNVRFAATELWGPAASARDSLYIDLWEDYLEPCESR